MISLVWKGSSAIYLKCGDLRVLLDPASLFSPEEISELGGVDLVLFTHEHSDHFDETFLESISREFDISVVCNPGVHRILRGRLGERVHRVKDGETVEIGGARVHALRSVHPGHHPVVLLLEIEGVAIFHGDSTGFSKGFQAFSPVDLAFIPVGSPSPNSSPSEAVRIVRAVVPRKVVPLHGSDREISDFVDRIRLSKLNVDVVVPSTGELVNLPL
ncbi:MAG: MBL fold metallo-hydrolase [Candidatus Korarchaeum sp.]